MPGAASTISGWPVSEEEDGGEEGGEEEEEEEEGVTVCFVLERGFVCKAEEWRRAARVATKEEKSAAREARKHGALSLSPSLTLLPLLPLETGAGIEAEEDEDEDEEGGRGGAESSTSLCSPAQ